jgi:hypothetical protein
MSPPSFADDQTKASSFHKWAVSAYLPWIRERRRLTLLATADALLDLFGDASVLASAPPPGLVTSDPADPTPIFLPTTPSQHIVSNAERGDPSPLLKLLSNNPPGVSSKSFVETLARLGLFWEAFLQQASSSWSKAIHRDESLLDRADIQSGVLRPLFETCYQVSLNSRTWISSSRTCELWLSDHYKTEFRKLDEFLPVPGLLPSVQHLQFAPLSLTSSSQSRPGR